MVITKLEELGKAKVKVYIDGEYHFLLYQKDIRIHGLKENESISNAVYEDIIVNTVIRRAKQKALYILKTMDRTEQELTAKLKQAYYTEEVISKVIEFMKSYHYIDDARYATNYVYHKKNSKSKRQIQIELTQKGIDKELIEEAFSQEYEDEEAAIQKAIHKKCKDLNHMTKEEKLKLSMFLYRKGFQMDLIKKHVNERDLENID